MIGSSASKSLQPNQGPRPKLKDSYKRRRSDKNLSEAGSIFRDTVTPIMDTRIMAEEGIGAWD